MDLKPLHDRVIILADASKEKSKGGIYLPDTAKEKPQRGRVIAVGPGKTKDGVIVPMQVKTGDKVLYGKYSGTEVFSENIEYLVIRENDIIATLGAS